MNTAKITFQTNIPVDLALKWTDGVNFNGQYGPGARFATVDGRTLLLPEPAANKLRALDLKPGQPFRAVKAEVNGQGRKRVEWQFEKLGEQRNGTFVVPKAGATPIVPAPALGGSNQPAAKAGRSTDSNNHNTAPWSEHLKTQSLVLVDTYAECLKHAAEKYCGLVKPDDVRTLVTTMFIHLANSKKGR